jgi:hypothetical protein
VAAVVFGVARAISEAKGARLSGFGFSVRGDQVQFHNQPLGPLAGAEASPADDGAGDAEEGFVEVVADFPSDAEPAEPVQ